MAITWGGIDIEKKGPFSNSQSISNSRSTSNSDSFSGLKDKDYISKLKQSLSGFSGNVDQYQKDALTGLNTVAKTAVREPFQDMLNSLASRNILNSSVVGDSVKKLGSSIGDSILSQGANILNQSNAQRLTLPSLYTAGADALKTNTSTGRQSSFSNQNSSSSSGNTLAPFELLAQYDWNTM